jgi:hypothetical protein
LPQVKTKPPAPPSNASSLLAAVATTVHILTLAAAAAYSRTLPEEVLRLVASNAYQGGELAKITAS